MIDRSVWCNPQDNSDDPVLGVATADGDVALVVSRHGVVGNIDPEPERLHLASCHAQRPHESASRPVHAFEIERGDRRGGNGLLAAASREAAGLVPQGVDGHAMGPDADLECVEFTTLGSAGEGLERTALRPHPRNVVRHANRERAVLRKGEVFRPRITRPERVEFGRTRDVLHGREPRKLVYRIEAQQRCRRKAAILLEAGHILHQSVTLQPRPVGGDFRRPVGDLRIVGLEGSRIRQVVDVVVAGHGGRLEHHIAVLTGNLHAGHVAHPELRARVHHHEPDLVGGLVAAAPVDARIHRVAPRVHAHHGAVIA